jgi:hypothetical protein
LMLRTQITSDPDFAGALRPATAPSKQPYP